MIYVLLLFLHIATGIQAQNTEGTCEVPRDPKDGRTIILGPQLQEGSIAVYVCDDDKELIGSSVTKCHSSGEWTFPPPRCVGTCIVPQVNNGQIGARNRFRFLPKSLGDKIRNDEEVILRCNTGYVSVTNNKSAAAIVCKNGEWSADLQCLEARSPEGACKLPSDPQHGKVMLSSQKPEVGSTALYVCDDDKELIGSNSSKCLSTGEWTFPAPKCVGTCIIPQVDNGQIRVRNRPRFLPMSLEHKIRSDEEVILRCNRGYASVASNRSEATIVCKDGEWSADFQCLEATARSPEGACELPSDPKHGTVKLSSQKPEVGSIALYICDDDKELIGSSSSKCLSTGEWTFPPPKCIGTCIVPQVTNGQTGVRSRFRFLPVFPGEKIRSDEGVILRCMRGYASVANNRSEAAIVCKDGEWSAYFQCLDGTCIVPEITNGQILVRNTSGFSPMFPGDKIRSDEEVILRCDRGYASVASNSSAAAIVCKDGEWSGVFRCLEENSCGDPPHLENAVAFARGNHHGDIAWYRCLRNFRMTKYGNISCLFGNWVGVQSTCKDTRCYINNLKFDGLVKGLKMLYHSSEKFTPSCQEGYRLSQTHQNEIICEDGEWKGHFPPCIQKENIAEHSISQTRQTTRSILNIFNTPTSAPAIALERTEKPQVHEAISQNPNDCSCTYNNQDPSVVAYADGKVLGNGTTVKMGTKVKFRCFFFGNHRLIGSNETTCFCGKWSTNAYPVCVKRNVTECPKITESEGLTISYTNELKVGSVAEFHCVPPYVMMGSSRTECRTNGTWQNTAPICQVPDCSFDSFFDVLPEDVVPDEINGPKVPFRSSVSLRCTGENMQLVGIPFATCGQNGIWEFGDIQCIYGCAPVRNAASAQLIVMPEKDFYTFGDTVQFYCPPGYVLSADIQVVICLASGWSEDLIPECVQLLSVTRCPKITESEGLTVSYTNEMKVGSVAEFHCAPPSVMKGHSRTKCRADGTWKNTAPVCQISVTRCPKITESEGLTISYTNEMKVGSIAEFHCAPPSVMKGGSRTECRADGTWQNTAPVCQSIHGCAPVRKAASAQLIVMPEQDFYTFGDIVQLYCPRGHVLSTEVHMMMCLASGWSEDVVPECLLLRER